MGSNYLYSGVFFTPETIKQIREHLGTRGLAKQIAYPHVTFDYGGVCNPAWFGSIVKVIVTGYANDGRNEAVSVDVDLYSIPKMRGLIPILGRKKLHITLSVAVDGEPKQSKFLSYSSIPKIVVYGRYGGFEERKFVVADCIVADELRRNTMPFFGVLEGQHTVSAKSLTVLKQKASRYYNPLNREVDTMVVVPQDKKAFLMRREHGNVPSSGKWMEVAKNG